MTIQEQNDVLFDPVTLNPKYQFKLPPMARELIISVDDGVSLNGLLYEQSGTDLLMLYFQGNTGNLQRWLQEHHMVLGWGYNVLVTDYRGFGKSEGMLRGQQMMYSDAEKVYRYAMDLGYEPEHIILYGYSMGTGLATHLAATQKARMVILESPYSAIAEMNWVGDKAPDYELNNAKKARQIDMPALIIHGSEDQEIPPDHSRKVFENLKTSDKKRLLLEDGGHGDLRSRPEYKELITDFVDQHS